MRNFIVLPAVLCLLAPCYGETHDGTYILDCFQQVDLIDDGRPVTLDGNQKVGFIHGLVEGISKTGNGRYFILPVEWTLGESESLVRRYLNDHPDELSQESAALVFEALKNGYPIKNKP